MAEVTSLGLGVHQTFHSAREKIMPVAFRTVANTNPASPAATATRSQAGLLGSKVPDARRQQDDKAQQRTDRIGHVNVQDVANHRNDLSLVQSNPRRCDQQNNRQRKQQSSHRSPIIENQSKQ